METRYLKYFIDVADTLSFTKAAQMNHVVQTTMSQSIAALENMLGFKLFERNNRNVKLTKLGQLFYSDAEYLLNAFNHSEHHISQLKSGYEGFLSVGYLGDQTLSFMPGLLKEFRSRYPDVGIDLMQGFPSKLSSLLEDGDCDLIFTVNSEKGSKYYEEIICDSQEICLVVNSKHRLYDRETVCYRDFENDPMVFFHPSCGNNVYNNMLYNCAKGGCFPNITGYASDSRSLIIMTELGLGVTLLPKSCELSGQKGVKFIPIQDSAKMDISACWLVENNNSALRNFAAVLYEKYHR